MTVSAHTVEGMTQKIVDPTRVAIPFDEDGIDHVARLPKRWSPSRLSEGCLRKQYYKTILGLSEPPSIDTVRGHLFHAVAERMFDVPAKQRTADHAKSLIAGQWELMVNPPAVDPDTMSIDDMARAKFVVQGAREVAELVPQGSQIQLDLFNSVNVLIDNWLAVENVSAPEADPSQVRFPDGTVADGREVHLEGTVAGVNIHGFVDRLNVWKDPAGSTHVMIADYKTGKMPQARFLDKSFFQLRLYALAFRDTYGVLPARLRLLYLKGTMDPNDGNPTPGKAQQKVTVESLDATAADIAQRHEKIVQAAETRTWPATTGPLCNWCHFSTICPAVADKVTAKAS